MSELLQWFHMGGYSIYIWSAYGLVLSVLGMMLAGTRWETQQTQKKLREWFHRQSQ